MHHWVSVGLRIGGGMGGGAAAKAARVNALKVRVASVSCSFCHLADQENFCLS